MRINSSLILLTLTTLINAQDIPKKVAIEICNCVDTIVNMDSLEARVNRCAPDAFDAVLETLSDEAQEVYSADDAVDETMNKAMESLLSVCPKIRNFILSERKNEFYRLSSSEEANRYYEDGSKLFDQEDYKSALKDFSKAFKKDPSFIYAIDNIALTYRKLGNNKKAIKFYNKSLEIYPEGSFALQNIALAYSVSNDLKSAIVCYQKLTFFYPDNPEGYFGIAKIYTMAGEYEEALDYVFAAHKIYSINKSDYLKDSENLISIIYNKLKESNKLDLFDQKAKEYGININ